ncbi:YtxH domain-containing protein [Bacillus dakarensis]|uniref:YtxH domain-containing protein n=1 Tax=Robertmurraya dakarensis TaxID=1926278 RepID=UPI000981738B|nr:YtxH domain-containing protein [Bacillus dakarensis]
MGSQNKFFKGILMGAIAGGAISLLDRETRKSVVESCKKGTKEVSYYLSHPTEMAEQIRDKTSKLRTTVAQVSEDVTYIAEKVEELREVTPSVAGLVKDTREAFDQEEKEN